MPNQFIPMVRLSDLGVFKNSLQQSLIDTLVTYVAQGKHDSAQLLLEPNRELALGKGTATDFSGREFVDITAFQYACWALDWHMWEMIREYLPKEQQVEQLTELMENGTHYGKTALPLFENLISAKEEFIRKYKNWPGGKEWGDYRQCRSFFKEKVGAAQCAVPVHVLQEYCYPGRPFYPVPNFTKKQFERGLMTIQGEHVYEGLGEWEWAGVVRGLDITVSQAKFLENSNGGCGYTRATPNIVMQDRDAVSALCKTRLTQFESLRLELGIQLGTRPGL